ncbi:MAG: DUF2294 family protein [Spirulinaceae cyanobacterium RM2_2_10]|nr:DUF2294 family protein [Spirulinaceae cyanobacterium SM2_1_0]NJO21096.1 DUF2294 family protein [Spirulinaceae cyanobacterium RM2_2_10]
MKAKCSLSKTQRAVLTERISDLYEAQANQRPREVTCETVGDGLAIIIEGILTHFE